MLQNVKGKNQFHFQPYPSRLPLRGNISCKEAGQIDDMPTLLLPIGADGIALSSRCEGNRYSLGNRSRVSSEDPLVTMISRVDPFNSLEAEDIPNTPRVVFASFIACSPYIPKPMKKCLNTLIIFLQQDPVFKLGYSQLLVHLYPTILGLFCHGIGTNSDTILATSVQVWRYCVIMI